IAAGNQPVSQVACAILTVTPSPGASLANAAGAASETLADSATARRREMDEVFIDSLLVFFLRPVSCCNGDMGTAQDAVRRDQPAFSTFAAGLDGRSENSDRS